jgi:hypothetical protein
MPTPTQPPPKPTPPPAPPPKPAPPPEAAKATAPLPIGAKPTDPKDPQAAKFEAHAAPPRWDEPKAAPPVPPAWKPEAALDPLAQKPPPGTYADGMSSADEQRARAAWVEQHGLKEYDEATDQRPDADKPKFDPHALAGGGAFVSAGAQKQVPGVVPPTKRE